MPATPPDDGAIDEDHGRAPARSAGASAAFAAIFLAGAALRIGEYLGDRSIWLDESWLANNIVSRSFAGLLRPLDDHQGAPLGFLEVEKLATTLLGNTEYALRLFPLISSIVALPLFFRVGRRLGPGAGTSSGLIAMALGALAPGLIYYASEGKQYAIDVTVALLILDAGLAALERGLSPRRALGLALLGAVGLWFSHPSAIVLGGVGASLFCAFLGTGRRREAGLVVAVALAWLGVLAVEYLVQLRALRRDEFLVTFWSRGYLAFPPRSMRDISKYFLLGFGAFAVPFEDYSVAMLSERISLLAFAIWLSGLAALASGRRWAATAMLAAPLAITTGLAMSGRYPLANRMILFLSAPMFPTMAAGLDGLIGPGSPRTRRAGLALVLGSLFALVEHDTRQALKFRPHAGAREVFVKVARDWRDGDQLVLHWAAESPFAFYKMTGLIPGLDRVRALPIRINEGNAVTVAREGGPLKGRPRVWVVADRHRSVLAFVPMEFMFFGLDASSRRLDEIESGNCQGVLYDCR